MVRRALILAAATATLLGLAAFLLAHGAAARCEQQNRLLTVLAAVVTSQADGPHRFNSPADVDRRGRVLEAELAQIEEARC